MTQPDLILYLQVVVNVAITILGAVLVIRHVRR